MAILEQKPWTYELYTLLPEDGRRHEVIDGEHYVTPSPTTHHQRLVRRLFFALETAANDGKKGEVFSSPCDVLFTDTNFVQPDLLYVSKERREIITDANIQGAPDLVVEVISPSSRKLDEVFKRDQYERFGVREYWIVDPELETVKVYRQSEDGGYSEATVCARERDDHVETPLLPKLSLSLAALFEEK